MLTILTGDALEQLHTLPSESVQCCVTSPPYWGLRDYGTAAWEGGMNGCDHIKSIQNNKPSETLHGGTKQVPIPSNGDCGKCGARRIDSQLGLEKTPEEYVAKMVEVFREVRRVLRKDGTLWLNLGDSYAGGGNNRGNNSPLSEKQSSNGGAIGQCAEHAKNIRDIPGLKPKDLCGIPWRVAFALQADGWWLRSDIIWSKPNPMPESVTDRPTKSHEYLFLLTKSANYFYDLEAIREPPKPDNNGWMSAPKCGENRVLGTQDQNVKQYERVCGANKRSVWTVSTAPYPEAHFATYPPDLIKPCIMAGTSAKGCCSKCGAPWERIVEREREATRPGNHSCTDETAPHMQSRGSGGNTELRYRYETTTQTLGWQPTYAHGCNCAVHAIMPCTVLDPFVGSGTTGMVALELGRKAVLIELNPSYVKLIEQRCDVTLGLQLA